MAEAVLKEKPAAEERELTDGFNLIIDALKLNGLSYQALSKINFQAGYTDAVSMMKDGHVQVFTLGTTAPASAVMDLASARDINLVPVDDATMKKLKDMTA